jgi:hypothetical protein
MCEGVCKTGKEKEKEKEKKEKRNNKRTRERKKRKISNAYTYILTPEKKNNILTSLLYILFFELHCK